MNTWILVPTILFGWGICGFFNYVGLALISQQKDEEFIYTAMMGLMLGPIFSGFSIIVLAASVAGAAIMGVGDRLVDTIRRSSR